MRPFFPAAVLAAVLTPVAAAAGPTCALLDPEKAPRAALLEAKLLADPSITWVERNDIDKVLAEQKLQAMFSPQGVGERVKLGKLLKADVLVMVRPVKDAKEPALEVVVSETAGGLRLMVRGVPVTKDADADVAGLLAAVKDGIRRSGEAVKEVLAVPPFVSNDLEVTHDYLKRAYAKLAEGEALDRRGVVVVELAEAEAVARELLLTGSKLDRPLPVYLLGEYRHEGKGKDGTISLKLRAERGGKPVGKPAAVTRKPDDAPEALRKWAAGVLDVLAKVDTPRPPADLKAEAKQLAARGRDFKQLGNWPEAVALFEASLLLDPDLHEVRVDILKTLGPPIRRARLLSINRDLPATELYLQLYRRGLEHLEALVVRGGDVTRYRSPVDGDLVTAFRGEANYLKFYDFVTPRQRELIQDAQKFERAVFLRLIPKMYHLDKHDHMPFVAGVLHALSDSDKLAMLDQLVRELPDTPRSVVLAQWYAQAAVYHTGMGAGDVAFRAFREKVAAGRSAAYKAASAQIPVTLKAVEDQEKARRAFVPPARSDVRKPDGVKLTYVELQLAGPTRQPLPVHLGIYHLTAVLRIGPATDLFCCGKGCFLMKEKGILRPLPDLAELSGVHLHFRFDGKYVWLSNVRPRELPDLYVLDPETEQVWNVTASVGLPRPTADQLKKSVALFPYPLASLGPGRVCLAGCVGDRTWIGVAEFDRATGKATVKVVAEARQVEDPLNKEQWVSSNLAFTPWYIHALAGPDDASASRVLIGRSRTDSVFARAQFHPLMVDPTGVAKPEVVRERMALYQGMSFDLCGEAGGGMYFFEQTNNPIGPLRRVRLPGPTVETIADGLPKNTRLVIPDGDRWHAVEAYTRNNAWAANWWTVEPGTKQARLAGTDLPQIIAITVSAHYGLVAVVMQDPDKQCVLYTVEVRAAGHTAAYKPASTEVPVTLKAVEDQEKARRAFVPPARSDVRKPDGVKLTYVELQLAGPTSKAFPVHLPNHRLAGVLRLGPVTDLFWTTGGRFFLMKEKRTLRPVPDLAGLSGVFAHVRFDGKYVWLSNGRPNQFPDLYVLDPETEQVTNLTAAAGLPRPTVDQVKERFVFPYPLAPLAPGRVCLAGRIADRTWIGVAEFERATGKATVKVVAEASEVEDRLNNEQWASPNLAFTPSYIHPVAGPDGAPAARVLVGRSRIGSPFARAQFHALMVDPTGVAKPEVVDERMGLYAHDSVSLGLCGEVGGGVYFFEQTNNPTRRLRRVRLPGPTVDTIADGLPRETRLVVPDGDRWHAVEGFTAQNWWTVEAGTKQARLAGTDLPPIMAVAVSAHYGLVAVVMRDPDKQCVLYTVEVTPVRK